MPILCRMRDKSPEELRKLHVPGKLDNRFRSDSTYQKAQAALRYEKVCAAAFTEAKLRREGIRNPDPDLVQQQAEGLNAVPARKRRRGLSHPETVPFFCGLFYFLSSTRAS